MSTPESKVKNEVKKQLKKLGAYQFWPVQTGMGMTTLDCLVCLHGQFFAIETKAPGKKPTPRQSCVINDIRNQGSIALVIDSVDMAKRLPEILYDYGIALTAEQGAHLARWRRLYRSGTGPAS
jgi:hypothetical protein